MQALFCILAQYGIRPDRYICPEKELPEFYGTPCPDDGVRRCYIRFSTNKNTPVGKGAVFVYCPYDKKSRMKNQLLKPRAMSDEDKADVYVPTEITDSKKLFLRVFDSRVMNEQGIFIGAKESGKVEFLHVQELEARYIIGKGIHEKLSRKGGRFLVTAYYPMGDNYRSLAKYEGMDYSDITFVVTRPARDMPLLMGVDGAVISKMESRSLNTYLSMNYYEDMRFHLVAEKPLYPGSVFHGGVDTTMLTGVARRADEPSLSIMGTTLDENMGLKRLGIEPPRTILLNPYGNTMNSRTDEEKQKAFDIMFELSRRFLKKGCVVYTNTPFQDQMEVPGTRRYEADMVSFTKSAQSFDLVVSVFTGFMEAVLHTDTNLVVLTFNKQITRKTMAVKFGRTNYREVNILENDTKAVVTRVMRIFKKVVCSDRVEPVHSTVRAILPEDKAALFKPEDINARSFRFFFRTMEEEDVDRIMGMHDDIPMLCIVRAKMYQMEDYEGYDIQKAIEWYDAAYKAGVLWAKEKADSLKESLES